MLLAENVADAREQMSSGEAHPRAGDSGAQRGRIHSATPMNGTYDAALTHEARHRADAGHQDAGDRRPEDAREVELGRVERETAADLLVA